VKIEGQTYVAATIAPDAAMSVTPDDSDGLSTDSRAGGWHPEVEADAPDPKPLSAKISGPLPWTRVDTPEEAAKVAAFVPSFNPVPKPGATKKARAR
jgi:hypothetical protein